MFGSVVAGGNSYVKEKTSFFVGLNGFKYEANAFDLLFCYSVSSKKATQVNTTSFELLLSYRLLK